MSESQQLPKPGDRIAGKYRIEGLLGKGGMGAVFEASHEITGKHFAIKLLLPDLARLDEVVKRFIREAKVAGRFAHPNVVEVYDIGKDGDLLFMVMELLQGEALSTRLSREGHLRPEAACGVLIPCMDGIAAAHAAGIIHRDIKPPNIFLCEARGRGAPQPKVLDFGISKLTSLPGVPDATKTDAGSVMGTPFYLAPEQVRAGHLDPRVDIYALGVTLYEMLSGRHPFEASSYAGLVLKIVGEPAVPLESRVSGLPSGLSAIVARAMARNRDDRFATVEQMTKALEPYAGAARPGQSIRYKLTPAAPRPASLETTERTTTPLTSSVTRESSAQASPRAFLPWLWGLAFALLGAALVVRWLLSPAPGAASTDSLVRPAAKPAEDVLAPLQLTVAGTQAPPTQEFAVPNSAALELPAAPAPPIQLASPTRPPDVEPRAAPVQPSAATLPPRAHARRTHLAPPSSSVPVEQPTNRTAPTLDRTPRPAPSLDGTEF